MRDLLKSEMTDNNDELKKLHLYLQDLNKDDNLPDDFSILKLNFEA